MSRLFIVVFCICLASLDAAAPRKKVNTSDGKIVGGLETSISQVPYQVSLQYYDQHICGGSIIDSRHILTAAHCVDKGVAGDFSIRVGSSLHASGGEVYQVKKVTSHPSYSKTTTNNDIAVLELTTQIRGSSGAKIMPWQNKYRGKHFDNDLAVLELKKPLKFSEKVKIIPLTKVEPKVGDVALVSGWGALKEGGDSSRTLQSVRVPVISRESCQRQYMRFNTVTDKMWCAGFPEGAKDACQGDSGGPAVVNGKLAGVVSWGKGCAKRNAPGVYTNIVKFLPWIAENSGVRRSKY